MSSSSVATFILSITLLVSSGRQHKKCQHVNSLFRTIVRTTFTLSPLVSFICPQLHEKWCRY